MRSPLTLAPRPTEDEGFTPTEQQRAVRAQVRVFVDTGLNSPTKWLNEFQKRVAGTKEPPLVTSDEWRAWSDDAEFIEWFYDRLYPEPDVHALRSLHQSYEMGLQTALEKGEPAMLKWYYDTVLKPGAGEAGGNLITAIRKNAEKKPWQKKPLA